VEISKAALIQTMAVGSGPSIAVTAYVAATAPLRGANKRSRTFTVSVGAGLATPARNVAPAVHRHGVRTATLPPGATVRRIVAPTVPRHGDVTLTRVPVMVDRRMVAPAVSPNGTVIVDTARSAQDTDPAVGNVATVMRTRSSPDGTAIAVMDTAPGHMATADTDMAATATVVDMVTVEDIATLADSGTGTADVTMGSRATGMAVTAIGVTGIMATATGPTGMVAGDGTATAAAVMAATAAADSTKVTSLATVMAVRDMRSTTRTAASTVILAGTTRMATAADTAGVITATGAS